MDSTEPAKETSLNDEYFWIVPGIRDGFPDKLDTRNVIFTLWRGRHGYFTCGQMDKKQRRMRVVKRHHRSERRSVWQRKRSLRMDPIMEPPDRTVRNQTVNLPVKRRVSKRGTASILLTSNASSVDIFHFLPLPHFLKEVWQEIASRSDPTKLVSFPWL